ncbi:MAG: hypothetical protein KJ000_05335 [Pirellulaceae bacterium]|nr:hypothetical protein [Pirellulaceae bacterium]
MTLPNQREILQAPGYWAQSSVIPSPDDRQWLMLRRENNRRMNSLFSVSDDCLVCRDAKKLSAALTGDRHVARYAPDGRRMVAMCDQAGQGQK